MQMIFEKQLWKLIVLVWSVALAVLLTRLPELLTAIHTVRTGG